jgi:hypothetical protein
VKAKANHTASSLHSRPIEKGEGQTRLGSLKLAVKQDAVFRDASVCLGSLGGGCQGAVRATCQEESRSACTSCPSYMHG